MRKGRATKEQLDTAAENLAASAEESGSKSDISAEVLKGRDDAAEMIGNGVAYTRAGFAAGLRQLGIEIWRDRIGGSVYQGSVRAPVELDESAMEDLKRHSPSGCGSCRRKRARPANLGRSANSVRFSLRISMSTPAIPRSNGCAVFGGTARGASIRCCTISSVRGEDELTKFTSAFPFLSIVQRVHGIEAFFSGDRRAAKELLKIRPIPVLVGPTLYGKSTFVDSILPPHLSTYLNPRFKLHREDARMNEAVRGCLLVEFAELASLHDYQIEDVKSWTGVPWEKLRLPYQAQPTLQPRSATVFGTANPDDPVLLPDAADDALRVRFLFVYAHREAEGLEERMDANRDQFFAEAMHRFAGGERVSHVPNSLRGEAIRRAAEYEAAADETMTEKFAKITGFQGRVTIGDLARMAGILPEGKDHLRSMPRSFQLDVRRALLEADFKQSSNRWVHPNPPGVISEEQQRQNDAMALDKEIENLEEQLRTYQHARGESAKDAERGRADLKKQLDAKRAERESLARADAEERQRDEAATAAVQNRTTVHHGFDLPRLRRGQQGASRRLALVPALTSQLQLAVVYGAPDRAPTAPADDLAARREHAAVLGLLEDPQALPDARFSHVRRGRERGVVVEVLPLGDRKRAA